MILPYLYRLRKHINKIIDTIAVKPSAMITADHIPSSWNMRGKSNTAPPLNINERKNDTNADTPPLQSAVKNPEHQILNPQKM